MTQRLPVPGQDDGTWGDILNGFLEVSLNSDGTIQSSALTAAGSELTSNKNQPSGYAGLNSSGFVPVALLPANIPLTDLAITGTPSSSNYLRGDGTWSVPNSGSSTLASDTDVSISSPSNNQVLTYNSGVGKWENVATVNDITVNGGSSQTGTVNIPAVQLAGDLGNTATSPQVTSTHLASALPINQGGTGSTSQNFVDLTNNQTIAGTKTFSSAPSVPSSSFPESAVTNLTTDLGSKAPTASPTFTGKVTTPALQVTTGSGTANQVLTSDVSGNATWVTPTAAPVSTVFTRTGAVVANTGDYTAAQVTGALVNTNNLSDLSNAGSGLLNLGTPTLPACDLVATSNITLSGSQTVDSTSTSTLRILAVGQSTASQNGPWVANTSGAWTRPTDFAHGASATGRLIQIVSGTVWANSVFQLAVSTSSPITVDTTSQTWEVVAAPVINITSTQTIVLPVGSYTSVVVGGGASGGGGGSAALTGGVATQVGGTGGGQGQVVQQAFTLTSATSITATVGGGGTSVGGGGASGGASGSAGGTGNPGSVSSLVGTGVSITALGGGPGAHAQGNSTSNFAGGQYGNSTLQNPSPNIGLPGSGGFSTSTTGDGGGPGLGIAGSNGGGGAAASSLLGGAGGTINGNGISSLTGTTTGGVGGSQPANSGLGGAGGGGGAPGGAGGASGAGGSGYITLRAV